MPQSVAYLGPEGTFSHILARKRFGEKAKLVPCATLDAIFDFVLRDPNARAIVPVENSSGGAIYDTIDLLIAHADAVSIREELALDVRPALLGHKGREIRVIHSHFVQLQHCREWIRENYPQAEILKAPSTAIAAREAARRKNAAAISARGAASLYRLDVLKFPILPKAVNVTHFFVLGGNAVSHPARLGTKTAFITTLKNRCGSLHAFLGPFARHQVNLKRIVSRPVPGHPETYVFFIEIEGDERQAKVRSALKGAHRYANVLKCLGAYPVGKKYSS